MGLSGLMTAIPANAEASTEDQQTAYETTEMTHWAGASSLMQEQSMV